MKDLLVKTSIYALIAASISVEAATSKSPSSQNSNSASQQIDQSDQSFPGRAGQNLVFAGAPFPSNSYNIELFGEFLWLDSGFDTVTTMTGNAWQTNPEVFHRKFEGFATHYQPAFRVGLGYQFEEQGWDLIGSYLYFKNEKSRTSDRVYQSFENKEDWGAYLAPVILWWPSDIQKSKYNLSYNQADLSIGKEVYFTKFYSFKPSIGPRYISAQYGFKNYGSSLEPRAGGAPGYATVEMSNNLNLFGFNFGLENKFLFGSGIYFMGGLNAGLGYAWTDVDYKTNYTETDFVLSRSTQASMKSRNMVPTIDARMDLGWERSFNDDAWAMNLYIGYDFHVLINAFNVIYFSIMASIDPETTSGITTDLTYREFNPINQHSNLYLQGLNVGLKVSF
jgi:hypothetical protein